jgi:hypothetical protein
MRSVHYQTRIANCDSSEASRSAVREAFASTTNSICSTKRRLSLGNHLWRSASCKLYAGTQTVPCCVCCHISVCNNETPKTSHMQGRNRSAVNMTGQLQERMTVVKLQAEHIMAGIICQLSHLVQKAPQMITDALRCLYTQAPSHLKWNPCQERLGCYVAEHSTEDFGSLDVYAINLLTGTALCNGHAPSHLPQSVLDNEVYQKVFGNVEFDVTAKVQGAQVTYRTVDAMHECFYSWCLKDSGLHVIETCNGQDLELLPRVPRTIYSPLISSVVVLFPLVYFHYKFIISASRRFLFIRLSSYILNSSIWIVIRPSANVTKR